MQQKKMNPWSIVAVLCAVGLCPLFSIAAILAGFRALVEIKVRKDTRGARLAWVSIFVGALVTGLWIGGLLWWNMNVRSQIERGPIQAVLAGQSGDLQTFESSFITPGSNEETAMFLASLHKRYGILEDGHLDEEIGEVAVDPDKLFLGMVPIDAELDYVLNFTNAKDIHLHGKFVLIETVEDSRTFTNRFVWIIIVDEEQGNLVYPASLVKEDSATHVE
jgi:hypothetical protein